jgi:hypothetical protein
MYVTFRYIMQAKATVCVSDRRGAIKTFPVWHCGMLAERIASVRSRYRYVRLLGINVVSVAIRERCIFVQLTLKRVGVNSV